MQIYVYLFSVNGSLKLRSLKWHLEMIKLLYLCWQCLLRSKVAFLIIHAQLHYYRFWVFFVVVPSLSWVFTFASRISYQECSSASIMKCSGFWVGRALLACLHWRFFSLLKKYLDASGMNGNTLRLPNEVHPGLMCYTHLVSLNVQSCIDNHRKLWTPEVIQIVKNVTSSKSQW